MKPEPLSLLQEAYRAALASASPERLLAPHLGGPRPDLIVAFGKASLPMTRSALSVYPGVRAVAVAPRGTLHLERPASAQVYLAAHPVPDESSVQAAAEVLREVVAVREGGHILVLVSGGGSALLCAPRGVTLAQKQQLTRQLLHAGADINEINAVRKHLSGIKGGQLAAATRASVRALLLSDVVGDDPATIASGPTVPDPTTAADALAVLDRYALPAPEARAHLLSDAAETPKHLPHASHTIIGNNRLLLVAAQQFLQAQGVRAVILGDTFGGEARELAGFHAALVRNVRQTGGQCAPVVLLSGGEATVTLPAQAGDGAIQGGRNQEFALALALALGPDGGVYALSAGSDGIDGSSPAAGACLTPDTLSRAAKLGLDAQAYLQRHDSGTFFARLGDQFLTGPSGHNLNDLRAIWVHSSA